MLTIVAILHLLAFFCFVCAAIEVPARINLTATGLAFWMLSLLLIDARIIVGRLVSRREGVAAERVSNGTAEPRTL